MRIGPLAYQIVRFIQWCPLDWRNWAFQAMKKVRRYRARRPVADVFYQRSRGADLYIIAGWRNQHTATSGSGAPHIKSLKDLKGKRVGISDFNSIRTGHSD